MLLSGIWLDKFWSGKGYRVAVVWEKSSYEYCQGQQGYKQLFWDNATYQKLSRARLQKIFWSNASGGLSADFVQIII